jgi:hypothetical protein
VLRSWVFCGLVVLCIRKAQQYACSKQFVFPEAKVRRVFGSLGFSWGASAVAVGSVVLLLRSMLHLHISAAARLQEPVRLCYHNAIA